MRSPGRVNPACWGGCAAGWAVGLPAANRAPAPLSPLLTGTPVRQDFLLPAPLPAWVPAGEGPLLLVMGGSQGALGLNRMVRPLVPQLLAAGCRVVHLTGSSDPEVGAIPRQRLCGGVPSAMSWPACSSTRSGHQPLRRPAASVSWPSAAPPPSWCRFPGGRSAPGRQCRRCRRRGGP